MLRLNSVKNYFARLLYPTQLKRFFFFFVFDILIIIFSLYLSFLLRFGFALKDEYRSLIADVLPLFIIVKLIAFLGFRLYRVTWRYVGLNDLYNIAIALIVSESVLMVSVLAPFDFMPSQLLNFLPSSIEGFSRGIFFIDGIISLILLSGLRISKRMLLEVIREKRFKKQGRRTIIIGSGHTGEMLIRDMARHGFSEFYPVGFLDDDKNKLGMYIHGAKVFGTTNKLEDIVSKHGVEAIIIAIPSLSHKTLMKIYNSARAAEVHTIKIIPRIYNFHKPNINLKNLEEIQIEDLIGRQAVEINYKEIEGFSKDKVVLVTGAGGSIGAEITMQVCGFYPEKVILLDNDETSLHDMEIKLKKVFPHLKNVYFITGDVRDKYRVTEVFKKFSPQIVFHAAAYKHVPMMEHNSTEAVKVNMFGTYIVAKAAVDHGVDKFIMSSTDKAIKPTSIMGATKRIAEHICRAFNSCGEVEFVSVRFGNVLGSRGSVVPLFMEQLKYGGPLTVTHREIQRYFMTIPEAVSLVLQASAIGKGGNVLVLDMGEPVKIVELAEELIRLHALEPYKDIDIEFVGLRPGEKLFEEILTAEEETIATKHEKVFIAKNTEKYSIGKIEQILKDFEMLIKELPVRDEEKIKDLLKRHVKHFDDGGGDVKSYQPINYPAAEHRGIL